MGLLTAVSALTWVTATENTMEKLEVTGFEAAGMANDFSGYKSLLTYEFVSKALAIMAS